MIGWLATVLSIAGLALNGRMYFACWPVWLASNVAWGIHAVARGDWPLLALQVGFAAFNLDGWRRWRQARRRSND